MIGRRLPTADRIRFGDRSVAVRFAREREKECACVLPSFHLTETRVTLFTASVSLRLSASAALNRSHDGQSQQRNQTDEAP